MTALRKIARLAPPERALLFRALKEVAGARLRLRLHEPARAAMGIAGAPGRTAPAPGRPVFSSLPPARFAWAVRHASRLVPGTKCLAQAIALHRLLQDAGHTSVVRIGVVKDPEKGFQAHAWVEHPCGPLLNTAAELRPYTPLTSCEGGRA